MLRQLILVKHAQPVLDPAMRPSAWELGPAGKEGSERLARALRAYEPFALASSPESKALATAAIVGRSFGVQPRVHDDLRELDRPALPIMTPEEHRRVNVEVFRRPKEAVLGQESAAAALVRFSRGVEAAIAAAGNAPRLVVIAHGTVIALLVAAHNSIEAEDLWGRLACPSFVVLAMPGYRMEQLQQSIG